METEVKEAINTAGSQNRFLSSTEMSYIVSYYGRLQNNLDAAGYLSKNAQRLIDGATNVLIQRFPYLVANPDYKVKVSQSVYALSLYLREVQYCLIADSTEPLQVSIQSHSNKFEVFFGLSPKHFVVAIQYIREQLEGDVNLSEPIANTISLYLDNVLWVLDDLRKSKGAVDQADPQQTQSEGDQDSTEGTPFWHRIVAIGAQIPQEAWEALPKDMSRNADHYLYGTPKEE